ncbi:polysaccharide deacetylase family protein [Bacillus tianshenii]|nr:polysaccharide deacetylase family protein [Bacillus tianshenii]
MSERKKYLSMIGVICLLVVLSILSVREPAKAITADVKAGVEQVEKEQTPLPTPSENENETQSEENKKVVYLTFDDGPSTVTGEILTLLDKYNAKATFFMLGPNIKKHPSEVKQMAAQGHGLGLHSMTHRKDKFYASRYSSLNEMNMARQTLEETTGTSTLLIRTPYGSVPYMKKSYRETVEEWGYVMWDWNIDSRDWKYQDSRYIQAVINQLQIVSKGERPPVILLHERKTTLQHLEKLLIYLHKSGYRMVPITKDLQPVQFKI